MGIFYYYCNTVNDYNLKKFILAFVFYSCRLVLFGQGILGVKGSNYYGVEMGLQMSGIRIEDFVSRNMSPKLNFYFGKSVNNIASVQFGYEGFYFNTIANTDKRFYEYYTLKIENKILQSKITDTKRSKMYLAVQVGGGLFNNKYYLRPNICADVGLIGSCHILDKTSVIIRINSICGWDLYQGDADIINNLTVGLKINI